jgi:hypothetical protein
MPIGDNITQPIPAVGTAGTGYATQFVNFLTEVKARLEAKVALASLLAGLFDLNNNGIANIKYAGLYEQLAVPSTPVGSLQRYGGNLYYVSPSGAVRITNGAALDAVSLRGITGAGYVAPAEFQYDLGSITYKALSDVDTTPDTWAYLAARAVDVYGGATSTNRVRLSWGGAGSYTLTLPAALPGSKSILLMDAAGNVTASNTLDNSITLANDKHITLAGTGDYKHGEKTVTTPFGSVAHAVTGTLSFSTWVVGPPKVFSWQLSASGRCIVAIPSLRTGWRLKKIKIQGSSGAAAVSAAVTRQLYDSSVAETAPASGGYNTVGYEEYTLSTPPTLVAGETVFVDILAGASAIDFTHITVTYDIP